MTTVRPSVADKVKVKTAAANVMARQYGPDSMFDPIAVVPRDDGDGEEYVHVYIVFDEDTTKIETLNSIEFIGLLAHELGEDMSPEVLTKSFLPRSGWPGFSRSPYVVPPNLIATARLLVNAASRETDPEQAQTHLKRAVGTAYYAMFHAVCVNAAELVPSENNDPAAAAAWRQAYRGPEHTHTRNQCRNAGLMAPFPPEIKGFAAAFVQLQSSRNQADYNPISDFHPVDVSQIINDAEAAIK